MKYKLGTQDDKTAVYADEGAGYYFLRTRETTDNVGIVGNRIFISDNQLFSDLEATNFSLGEFDNAGSGITPSLDLQNLALAIIATYFPNSSSGGGAGEYQPLNDALTDISALNPSVGEYMKYGSYGWQDVPASEVAQDTAIQTRRVGRYYSLGNNCSNVTTQVLSGNVLRAYPMIIEKEITIDELRTEVTTLAGATNYVFGIYQDNGGYPGALVAGTNTTAFNGASQTVQSFAIVSPVKLARGLYWVVYNANGGPTLRAEPQASIPFVMGYASTLGSNSKSVCWTVASTYSATLPSTFTAGGTTIENTNAPLLAMRLSA
jgi:hypothetical protein